MKILELQQAIENVGKQYSVDLIPGHTRIYVDTGEVEYLIIQISETEQFVLESCRMHDIVPSLDFEALFRMAVKYAQTALKERKPETLYYVHVVQNVDDSFLAYSGTMYCLGYKDSNLQTQFTEVEIEKMKRNSKLAIDWDKAIEEVKS